MKKQTEVVKLRVTPAEQARWKSLAADADQPFSDLVRSALGSATVGRDPVRRRPHRKADPELLAQLGRISGSLNQVARWCNTHKSAAESIAVLTALRSIEEQVLDLRQKERSKDDC